MANTVTIINDNTVAVTNQDTTVVQVSSGPEGPQGPSGSMGPQGASGSLNNFTGSASITGSLNITGSLSTTNGIDFSGPFTSSLTGSLDLLGSITSSELISGTSSQALSSSTVYIDTGDLSSINRIPMFVGINDGHYQLKNSQNEIIYRYRATNPVSGDTVSADYLTVGGGSNSAGGIFFNSTVGIPSFVYSDGPLHLFSVGYKVEITSSDHINLRGDVRLTGSLNISGSDVNFKDLPNSDPQVIGKLFQTSSEAIGANAGYQLVLISQG